jgi:hypothetical protein
MTIRITDKTTGDSYLANCVEDCTTFADKVFYQIVEAYGQSEYTTWAAYEIVEVA